MGAQMKDWSQSPQPDREDFVNEVEFDSDHSFIEPFTPEHLLNP